MPDLRFRLRPKPTRAFAVVSAQLTDEPPVTERITPERAFRYTMGCAEGLDLMKDVRHSPEHMRVDTRMSTRNEGESPILPLFRQGTIKRRMSDSPAFDIAALKKAIIDNTGPGKKYSRRKLSLMASNDKNPDLVRDFLSRGQDRNPSFDMVNGIASALGINLSHFIKDGGSIGAGVLKIRVVGAVEAGSWKQQEQWADEEQFEVVVYPTDFSSTKRFGLEVVGYSMDKVFLPGTILDCLGLYGADGLTPQPGDIVIVQRKRGDLCETTCKRLELLPDGSYQLRAESTRPEFSEPIPIGKPDGGHFGDDETTVIAIVNSAITRVLRR